MYMQYTYLDQCDKVMLFCYTSLDTGGGATLALLLSANALMLAEVIGVISAEDLLLLPRAGLMLDNLLSPRPPPTPKSTDPLLIALMRLKSEHIIQKPIIMSSLHAYQMCHGKEKVLVSSRSFVATINKHALFF